MLALENGYGGDQLSGVDITKNGLFSLFMEL
jgi:hypothetical protein